MKLTRIVSITCLVLFLHACASTRNALPEPLLDQAVVPGGSAARMWGDELPDDIDARIEVFRKQFGDNSERDVFSNPPTYLALSGGGANGAYGAGLLKGWSESGERPELFIVSGISTGALIAPYAFLGSDYDDELERLYTSMATSDIAAPKSLIRGAFSGAAIRFNLNHAEGFMGQLLNDTWLYKPVEPGAQTFWSQVISQDSITISVEAGKTYYVKGVVKMGVLAGRPTFVQVSEPEGLKDLAGL
jgi:hypothetical protein